MRWSRDDPRDETTTALLNELGDKDQRWGLYENSLMHTKTLADYQPEQRLRANAKVWLSFRPKAGYVPETQRFVDFRSCSHAPQFKLAYRGDPTFQP